MSISNVLTIAGSDPSGGAGIQGDMKTFAALGCYGMSVITALTAQNTHGVQSVLPIPPDFVEKQLIAIFEDIRVNAVKIGMLMNADIVATVAEILTHYKPPYVVLDPVIISTNGRQLLDKNALDVLKTELFPLATVITPNIPEAEELLDDVFDIETSARKLAETGCDSVVIKGGHSEGDICTDTLFIDDEFYRFSNARIDTKNTHGTGCAFASAVASFLAQGDTIHDAVEKANAYIYEAILAGQTLSFGGGNGAVQHFV